MGMDARNRSYMTADAKAAAAALGRIGGSKKSQAKTEANRIKGKLYGRKKGTKNKGKQDEK